MMMKEEIVEIFFQEIMRTLLFDNNRKGKIALNKQQSITLEKPT